jgi:iron(III) transport system substrate-binding protein
MSSRSRLIVGLAVGAVLLVGAFVGVVLATSGSSDDKLVIYSARSHYGEEQPFRDFASRTGDDLQLFGGDAAELYERLRSEGDESKADVLITVDAANLWRAKQAGLLEQVRSPVLDRDVPKDLRDPDGGWYGLTTRARTIMRSTERVERDAVTTYAGLGDPRWKGSLCLRTATSEYNVSFVADRIAKDGRAATERLLRSWMANDPEILGSDVDVLNAIADGQCDVGLTNTYYLGRELDENPDFPVAPVYADQQGRGTHVNLSGYGVLKTTDQPAEARRLLEYLAQPARQQVFANNNFEFPVAPGAKTSEEIAQFGTFKRDPIDVDGAGEQLDDALQLMQQVGWT